jgi:hypothetical protein
MAPCEPMDLEVTVKHCEEDLPRGTKTLRTAAFSSGASNGPRANAKTFVNSGHRSDNGFGSRRHEECYEEEQQSKGNQKQHLGNRASNYGEHKSKSGAQSGRAQGQRASKWLFGICWKHYRRMGCLEGNVKLLSIIPVYLFCLFIICS